VHLQSNPADVRNYLRYVLLRGTGLVEAECKIRDDLRGPLDDLKASNIAASLFEISLTVDPSQHLTFHKTRSGTAVQLLNLEKIFGRIYVPQRTGMARSFSFDNDPY
jgi:hypothetical protein